MDPEEDQTEVVKEAGEYADKKMAAYDSGSWLDKVKFRYHHGRNFDNPVRRIFFALFGKIR